MAFVNDAFDILKVINFEASVLTFKKKTYHVECDEEYIQKSVF